MMEKSKGFGKGLVWLAPLPQRLETAAVFFLLILILLGFGLRVFRLYDQSYWGDEVVSMIVARQSPVGIVDWVKTTAEPHPPLYYLALHFWIGLVGENEFAVRYLSVAFGTLAMALVFVLGRSLFGPRLGLAGVLLLAFNPLNVLQSRDARMYSLFVCLSLLATVLMLRLLKRQMDRELGLRWQDGLVYVITVTAGLLVHYNFIFVVAFQALFVVGLTVLPKRRIWLLRPWLAIGGATVLAYLPWLLYAGEVLFSYQGFTWSPTRFGLDTLSRAFWTTLFEFSGAKALTGEPWQNVATILALATLLIGIVVWLKKGIFQAGFLLLAFLLPIVSIYLLSLRRPIFQPRYLIAATPAFLLLVGGLALVGAGRQRLVSALSWVLLLPILTTSGFSLANSYFDPNLANADYRSAAQLVQRDRREGDGFVFGHWGVKLQFSYYYGSEPLHYLPPGKVEGHEPEIEASLTEVLRVFDRVWFVPYWKSDIDLFIEDWLDRHAYKAQTRWAGKVKLILYASPHGTERRPLLEKPIRFGRSFFLDSATVGAAPVEPGQAFAVALDWRMPEQVGENLKAVLRLVGDDGQVYGLIDRRPLDQATADWWPGQRATENRGLLVELGTPPGEYRLELAIYREASGLGLDYVDQQGQPRSSSLLLGKVPVTKAPRLTAPEALPVTKRLMVDVNDDLRLVGVTADRVSAKPGEAAALTVFWQARRDIMTDYSVSLKVEGKGGNAGESHLPMVGGRYPTSRWTAGEIIRDRYLVTISPKAVAGTHSLRLGLVSGQASSTVGSIEVGTLTVEKKERQFALPKPQRDITSDFGETIRLLGYDLAPSKEREVKLTLYWQALRETDVSFAVFVHLLNGREQVSGQKDSVPGGGASPTTGWVTGEVIADSYQVPLRPEATAGRYLVEIGLYDATSGVRLKRDNGEDRLILQEVSLP